MDNQQDTLALIASELVLAFDPVREAFVGEEQFKGFICRLGWGADGMPTEYLELASAIVEAIGTVEELSTGELEASEIAEVVARAKNLFERIQNISAAPPGVDAGAFLAEIGERLFELILTEYLARQHPSIFNFLSALDVIRIENLSATADKHAYVRVVFDWERIPAIFSDPLSVVKSVYGWGTPTMKYDNIFSHLSGLLHGLGFPVGLLKLDNELAMEYAGLSNWEFAKPARGLKIPFHYNVIGDTPVELSIQILELPASNGKLPGLVIQPGIPSVLPFDFPFGEEVTLHIRVGSDIGSLFGVIIRPDELAVKYPFQDSNSFPSAGFMVSLEFAPTQPALLVGSPGGVRLETKGGTLGMEVFTMSGEFEIKALAEIRGLALVLAAGEGDGFLQKILGDQEIKLETTLGVDWSSKTGFGFRGSANFEIAIPAHIELGPITISQLLLSLGVPPGPEPRMKLDAGLNIQADLGPLQVVVENIGMNLTATFKPGNLGPLDLGFGFKPPNGVGLSIDAGAVTGGGYLFFDFDKEEYAGILQLDISGFVTINAVGLITTKMPDNSKGFSLLVIMSVEFSPGIQLGFGFTFLGIGGILGLNRTVELEVLAQGIRTGILNNIMFPQGDIIANAPRIISDLRSIFPPEEGKFLVGPMVKLGWGTPTLISVSIGVIIEIPGNFAIVGVLRVALPTADAPLIIIQVAFIGAVEFDKQRLWFFASMFESRVIFITLEGEMGLLVAWGDDANFVVSVGGFHPRFTPPPLPFPSPRRIALDLSNNPAYSVRIEGYFAVTSNTVQFGARAELRIGLDDFGIQGHIAFDALFQFSPFYFIIEISASVSLRVFGFDCFTIRLEFSLEGPTPYRARGSGYISILFWEFSADFDVTWGESQDTSLPPITVMPLLKAEFEKIENWKAELPPESNLLVSLRKLNEATDLLVLHPVGVLRISQRAIPLDLTLDKIGSQKTTGANKFSVSVNTVNLGLKGKVDEQFAIAQFQNMSDAEKLSRPSYQPNPGGVDVSVSGNQLKTSGTVKRIVRYELITIDTNYKRFAKKFFLFVNSLFYHFFRGSAVTKSVLSQNYKQQRKPYAEAVEVLPDSFVVAFNANNAAVSDQAVFASEALAREYMSTQVAANPNLGEQLHVIPQFEAISAS